MQRSLGQLGAASIAVMLCGCTVVAGGADDPGSSPEACGARTIATGLGRVDAIAFAGDSVFVAAYDAADVTAITRVPLSGDASTTLASGEPLVAANGLAANGTHVYWETIDGALERVAIDGGSPERLSEGNGVSAIALDDDFVYYAGPDWSIARMPLDGGDAETVVAGQPDRRPGNLRVVAGEIYWVARAATSSYVMKASLAGGAPIELASSGHVLGSIGLRGPDLFVADHGTMMSLAPDGTAAGDGQILRIPIAGGAADVVATSQQFSYGLAVDASGLYWGGGSSGDGGGFTMTAPVNRIASGAGDVEPIFTGAVVDSMTPCGGGICWGDAASGDVVRYAECR